MSKISREEKVYESPAVVYSGELKQFVGSPYPTYADVERMREEELERMRKRKDAWKDARV